MTPRQNLIIDFKERVREANPLIDVVQEAEVRLRKSGKNWVGLCPFHQETKPSFTIFHDGQRYHCFGCGEKGDVFKFIEKVNGFDFKEAFQFLADRANLTIPQQVQRETKEFQEAVGRFLYDEVLKELGKAEKVKTNKEKDLVVQTLMPDIMRLDPLGQQRIGKLLEEKFKISRTTFSKLLKKAEELAPTGLQSQIKTLIPREVHLVKENGRVKYLLKRTHRLEIVTQSSVDGKIYAPKQDLPFKLMRPEILKIRKEDAPIILEKMIAFIKRYLEMPREHDYLILALWTAHTYLIEKFKTTPILYFHGVYETGKTRGGEVLGEIAFRGERLTSPTEAGIFRAAHLFKTSLIIDEVKLWGQDGNPEVARLIKSRYKRGQKVLRVNLNLKGEDQLEYFDVFGPLVLCTKETIDPDIQNRCILFVMRENSDPKVEENIDEAQAEWLRNQLTLLRAEWLDRELPKVEKIARRRLNEILQPLHETLMVLDPSKEEELKMIARELQKVGRDESSETLEAEIVRAIWAEFQEKDEPEFATKDIVDRLNEDRVDKHKLSSHLVTKCIKRLGYETYRTSKFRGFKLDTELLDRHYEQYGL